MVFSAAGCGCPAARGPSRRQRCCSARRRGAGRCRGPRARCGRGRRLRRIGARGAAPRPSFRARRERSHACRARARKISRETIWRSAARSIAAMFSTAQAGRRRGLRMDRQASSSPIRRSSKRAAFAFARFRQALRACHAAKARISELGSSLASRCSPMAACW